MSESILNSWYLSVVPIVIFLITAMIGTQQLKSVMSKLRLVIESPSDLRLVKNAINLNMRLAIAMLAQGVLFFVAWVLFALLWLELMVVVVHMLVFGGITFIAGLYTKQVEREFKAMRVSSTDPMVVTTWERWIKQWDEARLQLPD